MGSFPTASIKLSLAVNATNYEDTVQYSTTVANYVTDVPNIASGLWQYLYVVQGAANIATPNTTVKWIRGLVRINDVTGARTPYGSYTTYGAGASGPVSSFQENPGFLWNFHLGPFDFSDQPTLSAALSAQIAQAIAFTPNY